MNDTPLLSLLIPTRNRVESLRDLLTSLAATTTNLADIEVVLGVDADDTASRGVAVDGVIVRHVTLPAGLTMGQMNRACFAGSTGRFVMLMNDDVVVRTRGWDQQVAALLRSFDDGIVLVHVNDGIFGQKLCTFPILSRAFCEVAGGVCHQDYERYRIDDHIYGIFNLLAVLGHKRIMYLPDVLFEHLNFEQRTGGSREYQYDSPTLDRDAQRFEDLMPQRKSVAVALARHIDQRASAERDKANADALGLLTDSFALRRPEFVHVVSASTPLGRRERPLVTVVTSDLRRDHAQRCINRIKEYSTDCDLLILDNFTDPEFNHARVMNELIGRADSRWLVLLDDDVYVEPGWLDGLLAAAAQPGVGVVTPLHRGGNGHLSYSGVFVPAELEGEHGHMLDMPTAVRDTPTICSAAMLIDTTRCGHLRFDQRCLKYLHDLDYGLQAWEAGARVVCAPDVTVTHVGGGTLVQGSSGAKIQWDRDRGVFARTWLDSGRLDRLRTGPWAQSAYLDGLYSIPADLERILTSGASSSEEVWKSALDEVLRRAAPVPVYQHVLAPMITTWSAEASGTARPSSFAHRLGYLKHRLLGDAWHDDADALRRALDPLVERWNKEGMRVAVYGAGVHTEQLLRSSRLLRAPLVGLVDRNGDHHTGPLWGMPVVAPERIMELEPDVVLISSKAFQYEIDQLLDTLVPEHVERVLLYGANGDVRCSSVGGARALQC